MAKTGDDGAAESAVRSRSAKQTLSQFVARVLDQLSLSAWLPSAALVLLLVIVFQLGAALDASRRPAGPIGALSKAFGAIGQTSLGAALLLIAAVIVLTMVTQAFSFEAIRVLEGYWGTNPAVEWIARWRCERHRKVRTRLEQRSLALTEAAWASAAAEIMRKQQEAIEHGSKLVLTPNMISVLGAEVLGTQPLVRLNRWQRKKMAGIDWRDFAPPDILRRLVNLDRRLRDFPEQERMLPTALGNVLRHYEDETGYESVETLVQEVYDTLPFSLQVEHDEQRTRLDLYCSMVVVLAVVTALAVLRLRANPGYAAGAVVCGATGMWVTYRAAVASARAYGGLIVLAAQHAAELAAPHRRP